MKLIRQARAAFFNPRILLGFVLCLGGLALGVFALISSSVAAPAIALRPVAGNLTAAANAVAMVGPISQDLDLRSLPYIAPSVEEDDEPLTRHPRTGGRVIGDPVVIARYIAQAVTMPGPALVFNGVIAAESGCGCLPPDTQGDVGPSNYIESVNSSIRIYNKSGSALSTTSYNSFFSALASTSTPCGLGQNRGDGFVFYDQLADRWVVSDFAFASFPGVSFYQCIGVSKTNDPVNGGWWLYALQVDPNNPQYLGDYPKFAMWPDAWYLTMNLFTNNTTFNGVRVYALNRAQMINGTGAPTPNAVGFTLDPTTLGDTYSLVPAMFRAGSLPPAGLAEYLLAIDSPSASGVLQNQVHVWRFHVDFTTPANSTLGVGATHTPDGQITVNQFTDAFIDGTSNLVPQATTSQTLDTLGDKIMTPLVYTNFNGTESLWASHTINNNQNGTGPTAIRWYQFNVTGNAIPATAAQQQTFNNGNDGLWRWMPSIAVDVAGNMAIGYSTSSTVDFPSIRWAGRLATDAPSTLAQGEAIMQAGNGAQTSTTGRWGDYSYMVIDPTDNLSFWHANEYYSATSSAGWNTAVGKFRFSSGPVALSAVSRKSHAGTPYDVNLPLTGNEGIEDRNGSPAAGQHQVIATLNAPVTIASASASPAPATVSNVSISGSQVTINLSGVPDATRVTITLSGVYDGVTTGNLTIPVGFLIGDVNSDGKVNSADATATRNASGNLTTPSNFRSDFNLDGTINSADATAVRARSGNFLP